MWQSYSISEHTSTLETVLYAAQCCQHMCSYLWQENHKPNVIVVFTLKSKPMVKLDMFLIVSKFQILQRFVSAVWTVCYICFLSFCHVLNFVHVDTDVKAICVAFYFAGCTPDSSSQHLKMTESLTTTVLNTPTCSHLFKLYLQW